MGEIRFVGTGETRGYPYLVCKKNVCITMFTVTVFNRQVNLVDIRLSKLDSLEICLS